MQMFFSRYLIGLLVGILLGLLYPALASAWSLLILLGIFVGNELIGRWGFVSHWGEYRCISYALYTGTAVCAWMGIQFGSGNIGVLLVYLGQRIS